ncbi:MAG: exodeoxyribonuclease VII large subunit [Pseudomonas sp.]|nr:exodeoxyribonuclease VII large subunit [Pseudomonas sp.]
MSPTYLITSYKEKDQAKALGARWDAGRRQWYVPAGLDLAPFAAWLPATHPAATSQDIVQASTDAPVALRKSGVPLSQLLAGVGKAISTAFSSGTWTLVELMDVRIRSGHVYLELAERNSEGAVLAKSMAAIWASTAHRILPPFQQATGMELAAGMKLLLRLRPTFKPQYGFSLECDAIDAEYALGDLEARKREIRQRLQREGLWDRNRLLPAAWDYRRVLVVAPEGGAGLGDFSAEAARLDSFGLCQFLYAYSRFQGEGAANQIRQELFSALEQIRLNHPWQPDAIVILRGGGAANDLAWLNDYDLARAICELEIPVLTGIGHERDNTILDEVAHTRFDTPSKVIAGIEKTIVQRAQEAKAFFSQIEQSARRNLQQTHHLVEQAQLAISTAAKQQVAQASKDSTHAISTVHLQAQNQIRHAQELSQQHLVQIQSTAQQQLRSAKVDVPRLMDDVQQHSQRWLVQAKQQSQALMREIAGQGPEKTLARGFAVVRDAQGNTITSATTQEPIATIEFHDGRRTAKLEK